DEDELRRRGITFLPTSLPEALDELDKDDVLKEALGREYADYFIEVKREEWNRYHLSVSQWELDNYIGVF
ncbi:MAG: type I glutamate--ammonia ligase, partial [Chloroflexota bacterium]|nr:type I glutamate--ammonia ligase [Chloroflexota bacterium]